MGASESYCHNCDLLVGLDGFHVVSVNTGCDGLTVVVESAPGPMGCPTCGVVAVSHGRRVHELIDTPAVGRCVRLRWRKRRWSCPEPACPVGVFTEQDQRLARPRALLTSRACWWAVRQLRREHASVAGIARQLGTSWRTVWRAIKPLLEAMAADESRFDGVRTLGVDEHIWHHVSVAERGPKELTGMVDLTRDQAGRVQARLLDLVPGRSGRVYRDWLTARGQAFRHRVQVATLDPFHGYKNAIDDQPTCGMWPTVIDPRTVMVLITIGVARPPASLAATTSHTGEEPMIDMPAGLLQTRALTKEFRGFRAVDGVDLTVQAGTVHALVGPNGAGKTTLFNMLTGFLNPSSGVILFEGQPITGLRPEQIARRGIARSFQITTLFDQLSVREHIELALQARTALGHRFWASDRLLVRFRGRAGELLAEVGLAAHADRAAGSLSYGQKRALELALALALDPKLLLLDEPTAGMGVEDVDRTIELITRVKQGRTVVLVEHNMTVVASLADLVTVMQLGAVLVEGAYPDVRRDPRGIAAYLGDSVA